MDQSRPLGPELVDWRPPPAPDGTPLVGRYARLDRLDADRHAGDLHRAMSGDASLWDYMPYGPFSSASQYHRWAREAAAGDDPLFYAITDLDAGQVSGVASYLRIKPQAGSIEAGHINLAPALQRTRAATEAIYLMMDWAFGAGYRRFEWKCDALNMPSRRAAQRLGLSYEGTFRQATVVKGRNRDTAWFAAVDTEWSALKEAFGFWLDPANFDAGGRQRERLGALTGLVRVASDPAQNGG